MKLFQRWLIPVVFCLVLSGCANKWVKRPEADSVKTVALVSVYMDLDIVSDYGKKAQGGGLEMLAGIVEGVKGEDEKQIKKDSRPRKAIITGGTKVFAKAIHSLPGWKILPFGKMFKNRAYNGAAAKDKSRTLAAISRIASKIAFRNYVSPPKMPVIPIESIEKERDTREGLAKLAKSLGVDAVAVAHVVLAYNDGWISVAGFTKASPQAAAEIIMVNREGEIAVRTSPIKSKSDFMETEGEVWVQNRNIRLDGKARKLYLQAINMKVARLATKLREELTTKE